MSAFILSLVVDRTPVGIWSSWSTVWNAWCSRVKGLLVWDRDLVVYKASGSGSTCLPPPLHGCGQDQRAGILPTWGSWKTGLLPMQAEFSFYRPAAHTDGRTSRTTGLSLKCALRRPCVQPCPPCVSPCRPARARCFYLRQSEALLQPAAPWPCFAPGRLFLMRPFAVG